MSCRPWDRYNPRYPGANTRSLFTLYLMAPASLETCARSVVSSVCNAGSVFGPLKIALPSKWPAACEQNRQQQHGLTDRNPHVNGPKLCRMLLRSKSQTPLAVAATSRVVSVNVCKSHGTLASDVSLFG